MKSNAELVKTYILAKDGNRPHLMKQAFAENAVLEMVVNTGTISFPPLTEGVAAISDVLVRRFNQTYENVYTLCLVEAPQENGSSFSCDWLVGMTEKETGNVRVGCGKYDWIFQKENPHLVEKLIITLEFMQVLPPENLYPVMDWISNLPYPYCPVEVATKNLPKVDGIEPVIKYITGK